MTTESGTGALIDLQREVAALRQENERLRQREADLLSYLRNKIDNLLKLLGTFPLRPDELDDEHMITFDPIGIITETFAHILENLRDTNAQLELARDEIAAIFNAAGAGILVLDPERKILSCNQKINEQFKVEVHHAIGQMCSTLLCHDKVDSSNCVFCKVMASGKGEQTFGWHFGERYFDVLGAPVKGADGQIVQVVIVYLDVSARLRAERELNVALHQVDTIIRSISEGLLVLDPRGLIRKVNPAAETIVGQRQQEMIGRQVTDFFPGSTLNREIEKTTAPSEDGDPLPFDLILHGSDSRTARCFQARIARLADPGGGERGLLLSLHDMTRERMIERMKSDFVSTAAHELRTPLATIIGYSELLLDPEFFSAEQRQEFVQLIFNKAGDLSDLIDDLLDISRIESGQEILLDRKPISLVSLADKSVEFYRRGTTHHRFELIHPEGPVQVEADPLRCGQIFDNLLSNAVKYSPAGGLISVVISVNDGRAQVMVRDQGIGMTADQVARIFDKFYRADRSNTAISGTGLGMTIVQDLVEAHGGEVRVASEPGRGTLISFTLPLAL